MWLLLSACLRGGGAPEPETPDRGDDDDDSAVDWVELDSFTVGFDFAYDTQTVDYRYEGTRFEALSLSVLLTGARFWTEDAHDPEDPVHCTVRLVWGPGQAFLPLGDDGWGVELPAPDEASSDCDRLALHPDWDDWEDVAEPVSQHTWGLAIEPASDDLIQRYSRAVGKAWSAEAPHAMAYGFSVNGLPFVQHNVGFAYALDHEAVPTLLAERVSPDDALTADHLGRAWFVSTDRTVFREGLSDSRGGLVPMRLLFGRPPPSDTGDSGILDSGR